MKANETIDSFLNGKLLIIQSRKGYRFRALHNLTIFVIPMKRVDFSEVTGVRALTFRNLSVGEAAGPDLSGQCGGGKTPP